MDLTDRILARIGLPGRPPADLGGLRTVHRAFLAAVPYENIAIQLGEAGPLDDLDSARRIAGGRGGYCFEMNATLALSLDGLGFAVERRRARVGERDGEGPTNHLALIVDVDGESWLADAGLGEGPVDPLPLRPGTHPSGAFSWTLEPTPDGGWWVDHHRWGSLAGFQIAPDPSSAEEFAEHHLRLSTHPESKFVLTLVVQRTYEDRIVTLRARTLSERGPRVDDARVLADRDDLDATLRRRFGLELDGGRIDRLWERVAAQHERRLAAMA